MFRDTMSLQFVQNNVVVSSIFNHEPNDSIHGQTISPHSSRVNPRQTSCRTTTAIRALRSSGPTEGTFIRTTKDSAVGSSRCAMSSILGRGGLCTYGTHFVCRFDRVFGLSHQAENVIVDTLSLLQRNSITTIPTSCVCTFPGGCDAVHCGSCLVQLF